MEFSIIYEFDIPMDEYPEDYAPPEPENWDLTEESDGEESDWCAEVFDGKVQHRKYCGILSKDQFADFMNCTGLYPEDVETMGSLGAPGCGFGLAPAISLHGDDPNAIQSAYVTPLPEVAVKQELTPERCENVWRRVRRAFFSVYA